MLRIRFSNDSVTVTLREENGKDGTDMTYTRTYGDDFMVEYEELGGRIKTWLRPLKLLRLANEFSLLLNVIRRDDDRKAEGQ